MDTFSLKSVKFKKSYNLLLAHLLVLKLWLEKEGALVLIEHKFLMSISLGTVVIKIQVNPLDDEFYVLGLGDKYPRFIAKNFRELRNWIEKSLNELMWAHQEGTEHQNSTRTKNDGV